MLRYLTTICCLFVLCTYSHADVYRWVDEKGKVHLSDERSAPDHAVRMNSLNKNEKVDNNTFIFIPDADTLLRDNQRSPQGTTTALSAGFWTASRSTYEITSLIRFDISALLAEMNTKTTKKISSAHLKLYANVTDKIHPADNQHEAPVGHYSEKGDNAFHLKAVRNNWDEQDTIWQNYYNDTNYTPRTIRALPAIRVEGSSGNNNLDYTIDLTELILKCVSVNMRELTLELRPQRRSSYAEVTFYSKEANADKRPELRIELIDNSHTKTE